MVNDPASRRQRQIRSIAQGYRESHEVMSAALSIAIFAGGGHWLDLRYGCEPWLMICGVAVGSVFAGASLRRLLIRLDKRSKQERGSSSPKGTRKS